MVVLAVEYTSVQGAGQGRAIRRGVRTGLGGLGGKPMLRWRAFASGSLQIVVTGYRTDSNVAWRAAVLVKSKSHGMPAPCIVTLTLNNLNP